MTRFTSRSNAQRKCHALHCFHVYVLVIFLLGSHAVLLTGCGSSTAFDPEIEYARACADASTVTYEKISQQLTPIHNDNKDLIWENNVPGTRVLVVSFAGEVPCKAYECPPEGCSPTDTCKAGRECPNYKFDTWVTVAPEMKNYFKGTQPDPLRIAQLLGLPPSDAVNKKCFIEIFISPKNLYRPCPDPEITDRECLTDFNDSPFIMYDTANKIYSDQACEQGQCGFKDFEGWFNNRKDYLYSSSYPYPWTRLGYTYDWGDPQNHVGLSEFVMHGKVESGAGVPVKIVSVTKIADYFK